MLFINHRVPNLQQPRNTRRQTQAKRNLFLIMFESSITAGLISMSIMTPFYLSLGMTQAEIALSQAIFTIVISFLNLPAGWVADRFGRKWANVVGDIGGAISFLLYSQIHGFAGAVICECLLGLFHALSQGVDLSLVKHFSGQISQSESYFRQQVARLNLLRNLCTLALVLLGGPIGAISFRLAIALSSVPQFIGGIISMLIIDDGERLVAQYRNPLQDMFRIATSCWHNHRIRLRILVYAIGREMTHGIIWVYTPILLYVGVPLAIVSLAWAINSLFAICGSYLASHYAPRLHPWQILAIPLFIMSIAMGVLSWNISIYTVWLYFAAGTVQGWTGATLSTLIQSEAPAAEQTSVVSLAHVAGQLVYVPAVSIIGKAADFNLHFAPLMTLIIFIPAGCVLATRLAREP